MKVKQLIKKLEKLDPNLEVYHKDFDYYIYSSTGIHVGYVMVGAEKEISPTTIKDGLVNIEDVVEAAIID